MGGRSGGHRAPALFGAIREDSPDGTSDLRFVEPRRHFQQGDTGAAESFAFDRVPQARGSLVMAVSLVFHGEDGEALSVNDHEVGAFAIDGAESEIAIRRLERVVLGSEDFQSAPVALGVTTLS